MDNLNSSSFEGLSNSNLMLIYNLMYSFNDFIKNGGNPDDFLQKLKDEIMERKGNGKMKNDYPVIGIDFE